MTKFKLASIPPEEVELLTKSLVAKPPEFFEQFLGPNPTATQITDYIRKAVDQALEGKTYLNDKYQVNIREAEQCDDAFPAMWHLSIKRLDRAPIFSWTDMQRIKSELIGPENEAVQLFPAESRLLNTANQYHIFCLKDPKIRFPFGFQQRIISDESVGKSVNRPIGEKP